MPDDDREPILPSVHEYVGYARVLAGAVPFKEDNVTDNYRGAIITSEGQQRTAVIKDLPPKELANEVFAAALGLAVGLPIPTPYIAIATPDRLAAKHGPEAEGGGRLVFATTDVAIPSVRSIAVAKGPASRVVQALIDKLASWPDVGAAFVFDEYLANIDRNAGNLLFSGSSDVWLIDHGKAFTGEAWAEADLSDCGAKHPDRLVEWLLPRMSNSQRTKAASGATAFCTPVGAITVDAIAAANHFEEWLTPEEFEAVKAFAEGRKAHLPSLLASVF